MRWLPAARTFSTQPRRRTSIAGYHLIGPKFSKFNDNEPLDRQDAETGMRVEAEEFAAVDDFHGSLDDLRIDVFGPVAIATAILVWGCLADGERVGGRTRCTVVFVDSGGDWLIAHEHLSPFPAAPDVPGRPATGAEQAQRIWPRREICSA